MSHAVLALPAAIAQATRVDLITDNFGRLIIVPQMRQEIANGVIDGAAMLANDELTLIGSPGADTRLCMTSLVVSLSSVLGATTVQLLDGAAGTVLWSMQFAVGLRLRIAPEFLVPLCFSADKAIVLKVLLNGVTVHADATAMKAR